MNNPISDTARTARRCANVRMVSFPPLVNENIGTVSRKFLTVKLGFSRMANFPSHFHAKKKIAKNKYFWV